MSNHTIFSQSDLQIARNSPAFPEKAIVRDPVSQHAETFPADMSDEHIRHCVGLINRYHAQGVHLGEHRKSNEIKSALGITG
ncbi:hypothetical protein D3C87_616540 [compost metagenome]